MQYPEGAPTMELLRQYRQQAYADSARNSIKTTNYTHDACIDAIIANPTLTQNELAAIFGFSVPWMSRVINSDAFQAKLAARQEQIIDPALRGEVEAGFKALVQTSTEVLLKKISATEDPQLALKALEVSTRALGYGARAASQVAVQTNVSVAVVPAKSASGADWVKEFSPTPAIPQLPGPD